jgi:cytochrome c oxidase subunit IV
MVEETDTIDDPTGHPVHAGPSTNTYLVIFGALCVFTLLSFVINAVTGQGSHSGAAVIMLVAVCKAVLVAMFFMHLKYDWFKLWYLVIPVMILTVMMMLVLMPDIVLAWRQNVPLP